MKSNRLGCLSQKHLFRLNVIDLCVCACVILKLFAANLCQMKKKTYKEAGLYDVHVALQGLYSELYKCKV